MISNLDKSKEGQNPRHIAIIMDGNGRWAKERGLPRILGHHAGVKAVERTVRAAKECNIPYISLYAFSTENWSRPKAEVSGLMGLLKFYVRTKIEELCMEQARVRFAGKLQELPKDIREIIADAESRTKCFTERHLLICLNYGGRQEILDAVNSILESGTIGPITENVFREHLYLKDIPDPDLIIRTSGELRLSNFWLWQSSYSELYFTEKYWPDFSKKDLEDAISAYSRRNRRYGKI